MPAPQKHCQSTTMPSAALRAAACALMSAYLPGDIAAMLRHQHCAMVHPERSEAAKKQGGLDHAFGKPAQGSLASATARGLNPDALDDIISESSLFPDLHFFNVD